MVVAILLVLKDIYDFSGLVKKEEVIVVSINYRLGPFGWFSHPSIQNFQSGLDKTSNFRNFRYY